ncbi:transcription initiation factor TFIID subunit 4-like [Passer montanus]|uniref:transcription initiation factor TFIID subunit 4-like n=1 Tax=Passer montanus TaxID=9160 RepID=UPI00195FBB32|nr:transcription initiation factor TFIID subunit 4-like [Passer montanus]
MSWDIWGDGIKRDPAGPSRGPADLPPAAAGQLWARNAAAGSGAVPRRCTGGPQPGAELCPAGAPGARSQAPAVPRPRTAEQAPAAHSARREGEADPPPRSAPGARVPPRALPGCRAPGVPHRSPPVPGSPGRAPRSCGPPITHFMAGPSPLTAAPPLPSRPRRAGNAVRAGSARSPGCGTPGLWNCGMNYGIVELRNCGIRGCPELPAGIFSPTPGAAQTPRQSHPARSSELCPASPGAVAASGLCPSPEPAQHPLGRTFP